MLVHVKTPLTEIEIKGDDPCEIEHSKEGRAVYSLDLFDEKVLDFIRDHKEEPFFLFHLYQLKSEYVR